MDDFLACNGHLPTPFLVVDLDVVRERYRRLRSALPAAGVWFAVKANPDPSVVRTLAELGSSFDVASPGEIDLCLGSGVTPDRLSYGNTVKKERDIATAYERGVRIFAVDSPVELDKIVRNAPGSTVLVRLASDGDGADWPLSRKFGCSPDEAAELLHGAAAAGLRLGVSFHVGSQQRDPRAWDAPLTVVECLGVALASEGHRLSVVNLGGGLPSTHFHETAPIEHYGTAIGERLERLHDATGPLEVMVEPGRYIVGDAGVIRSEVVLVSTKGSDSGRRWVYLDIGLFTGLVETQEEAIRYRMRFPDCAGVAAPAVLAGPTCDSLDVLYERELYPLPVDLAVGQTVDLLSTGAYTTSYSSVWFNGFEPLRAHYLPLSSE